MTTPFPTPPTFPSRAMEQDDFNAAMDDLFAFLGDMEDWANSVGTPGLGGGDMTGALNEAYATVASAATTADIWSAAGNVINFTGTATVTAFPAASQAGSVRKLICAAACAFTNGANLKVPGAVNYQAAAGDVVWVYAETTTSFRLFIDKNEAPSSEGTWTPSLALATPGSSSFGSTTYSGYYKRRGNVVHVLFALAFTPTVGTGAGNLEVSGLPVNAGATTFVMASGSINQLSPNFASMTTKPTVSPTMLSTSKMGFATYGPGAGSGAITVGNLTDGAPHAIRGSLIYFTDV
jgi:hypothetical protein